MELREALTQISEIRRQMAKSDVFRGYRSAPVAVSGLLALGAAAVQSRIAADPVQNIWAYLTLWIGVAVISMLAVAFEMTVRLQLTRERTHLELTRLAVEQFLPCVVAGVLVTAVLVRGGPQYFALLPGLWQILFGLGICASARLLPKPIFAIGAFYLGAGIIVLLGARDGLSLAPLAMGLPFGIGQLVSAGILYWTLERARMTDKGNKPVRPEAPFAYEGLERVIHEKARLGILASLATHTDGLAFSMLKQFCALTDGNLNRHLQVLQDASLVEVRKANDGNRPQTFCKLTPLGRRRFVEYIGVLEKVVEDALQAAQGEPSPEQLREGWSPA